VGEGCFVLSATSPPASQLRHNPRHDRASATLSDDDGLLVDGLDGLDDLW
jgi:hypothetical protein